MNALPASTFISQLSTLSSDIWPQENDTSAPSDKLEVRGSWESGGSSSGISMDTVSATLYWVIFCLSVSGNLSVLAVISLKKTSERHKVTKILISSLAVADLCLALFVTWTEAINAVQAKWKLASAWCPVYSFARSTLSHCSTYTLAVIGFERYMAVSRPKGRIFTPVRAVTIIAIGWILNMAVNLPWILDSQVLAMGPTRSRCSTNWDAKFTEYYTVLSRVVCFFMPLVVTILGHAAIVYRLWKSGRKVTQNSVTGRSGQAGTRRVAKMCLLVVCSFVVTWTPFETALFYMAFGNYSKGHGLLRPLYILASFNSCINPLIYGTMWKPFREGLEAICRCKRVDESENTNTTRETHKLEQPGASCSEVSKVSDIKLPRD